MITGIELKQFSEQGKEHKVMVARNHGSMYGAIVVIAPQIPPLAINHPGTDEVLKFDSPDEVASFLAQVGIKQFQVAM